MVQALPFMIGAGTAVVLLLGSTLFLLAARRRSQQRICELETALHEKERQQLQWMDAMRRTRRRDTAGRLTRGIAHDFNNLLTAILGYSEMIQEQLSERKDLAQMQGEIIKAGQSARDMVRRLLTFCRNTPAEHQPLPLLPLLQDTHKLLRTSVPAGIAIHIPSTGDFDHVLGDAGQLQQVFITLAMHLVDALGAERKGAITFSLSQTTDPNRPRDNRLPPGNYICLCLSDRDPSRPSPCEDRPELFTPFSPDHRETEDGGLNLAAARDLIEAHRGALCALRTPDGGTVFQVLLPRLAG